MLDQTIRRLELSYNCPACGVRVDGAVGEDADRWLTCPSCHSWHWIAASLNGEESGILRLPSELWGCTVEWVCPACGGYNRSNVVPIDEPEETEVRCAECNAARHLRLVITLQETARTEVF